MPAMLYVSTASEKIKAIRYNLGSYTLKHSVEYYHRQLNHFDDAYVSNGAFICAALHMGFKVIRKMILALMLGSVPVYNQISLCGVDCLINKLPYSLKN